MIAMKKLLLFKVTISGDIGLSIVGKGQNQLVQVSPFKSSGDGHYFDGTVQQHGDCDCDNEDEIQSKFTQQLNDALSQQLTTIFDQKFSSVSIFALKNILFPAKNLIDMQQAYVPGDLVIFGNFTKDQ